MNETVELFGAAYSVYVRAARLALEEKGVPYELVPIDIFGAPPSDYAERHPFKKIPAFQWRGFRLYETQAIMRFVDEGFDGPALQPSDAMSRARMTQAASILDSYAYRSLVWGVYFERVQAPLSGCASDEKRIAATLPRAETCLIALDRLLGEHKWFGGDQVSLADMLAIPMFAYFVLADEAEPMMASCKALRDWWSRASQRPTVARTRPDLGHSRFESMA